MHPFPPRAELKFLIGLEVGQICLDPWSTQFRFTDGGQITLEGPFEHLDAQGHLHRHQGADEQDRGAVFLRELIQQRIAHADVEPSRLILTFANGAKLTMLSEAIPFESGQIYPPGREDEPIAF